MTPANWTYNTMVANIKCSLKNYVQDLKMILFLVSKEVFVINFLFPWSSGVVMFKNRL